MNPQYSFSSIKQAIMTLTNGFQDPLKNVSLGFILTLYFKIQKNIEKFTLNSVFYYPISILSKLCILPKIFHTYTGYLSFPSPPFLFFPYFSLSLFSVSFLLFKKILSLLNCIIVLKLYYSTFLRLIFHLMYLGDLCTSV